MPIFFFNKIFIHKYVLYIMVYIKYFETEEERQACTDKYKYLALFLIIN